MAVLLTPPYLQFFDDDGAPLAGGKVYTYSAGTTTPKATYTNSSETTPLSNPVILDSAGRATIWITGSYFIEVKTSADVLVKNTDNITAFNTTASSINSLLPSQGGNAGKSLVTDGSNVSWGAAPAGTGWVPIKTVTAAAVSSVDFVNGTSGVILDGTYTIYAVVISGLVPASSNVALWMRTSTNAGSSYDNGASNYYGRRTNKTMSTVYDAVQANNLTEMTLTAGEIDTDGYAYGMVLFSTPNVSTVNFGITANISVVLNTASTNALGYDSTYARAANADVDAIRFLMSSGNIASGTFTLYGLAG